MLIVKDMSSGRIEEVIVPEETADGDDYDAALSAGWDPAVLDAIQVEPVLPTQGETAPSLPPELAEVDVDAFLKRMYSTFDAIE